MTSAILRLHLRQVEAPVDPGPELLQGHVATSAMVRPATRTFSASGRTRAPPHRRQGTGLWYWRRKTRMYCL